MLILTFTKISKGNDWGRIYYAPAHRLLDASGHARESLGLKLYEGQSQTVRWPNGEVTTETMVRKPFNASVGDMGHDYAITTANWGVEVVFKGVKVFVDLEHLEVELP